MNVALAHLDNFLLWFPLFSIVIAKIFCLLYDVNQCRRKKPQWKLAGNIETIFFRSNRLWNREHIENNLNCHGSGTNTHSHTPNRVYLNMEIKKSKKSYYLCRFLNGSILAHMIFCSSSLLPYNTHLEHTLVSLSGYLAVVFHQLRSQWVSKWNAIRSQEPREKKFNSKLISFVRLSCSFRIMPLTCTAMSRSIYHSRMCIFGAQFPTWTFARFCYICAPNSFSLNHIILIEKQANSMQVVI